MTTYVLVHGGGHGGWCWDAVAERVWDCGHEVLTPTLAGVGERSHLAHPGIDLDTHVEEIRVLLADCWPGQVVLVGHSYGGMVITGAADRAAGRVARLVYLDAVIPHDGEALLDSSPGLKMLAPTVREVNGVRLGLWPDESAAAIYGLTDPALARTVIPRLTPHPWRCFEQPLLLRDPVALARIPRTIVNCAQTLRRRPEATRRRWLEGEDIRTVDAPHDLMLTHPDLVADILLDLAVPGDRARAVNPR